MFTLLTLAPIAAESPELKPCAWICGEDLQRIAGYASVERGRVVVAPNHYSDTTNHSSLVLINLIQLSFSFCSSSLLFHHQLFTLSPLVDFKKYKSNPAAIIPKPGFLSFLFSSLRSCFFSCLRS